MFSLSWFWQVVLATIALLLLSPIVLGINAGLTPDSPWSGQVEALPVWLRIWLLGILFPSFLASLFFLRRSPEARFAAGGFVLSHLPMIFQLFDVTVGGVGLMHLVCWGPALILLAQRRPKVELTTAFGAWVHAMLFVIAVSLTFDLRDALLYFVF